MTEHLKAPSISVVIPCYNGERYLRECINSVVAQTYRPLEILVVDDGSTDGSAAIVKSFGSTVQLLQQKNQGVAQARNLGIHHAIGDWIAIQDADDVWHPNKLEIQMAAIQQCDTPPVCCYTDFYIFGDEISRQDCNRPEHHAKEHAFVEMLADWSITSNSAIFLNAAAKKVKFPVGLRDCEDTIFFALLRRQGIFLRVSEPLAGYRKHSNQRTALTEQDWLGAQTTIKWVQENAHYLNPKERQLFSQLILPRLIRAHESAFWRRDWDQVKQCRSVFKRAILPFTKEIPVEIKRTLLPRPWMVLKDWIYRLLMRQAL